MPREAPTPSVSNLRSAAATVRAAISGLSGPVAGALTALAAALDHAQAAVESLEGKNRELASPDTRDPRRKTTAFVSGDRILGGIPIQGVLPSVAGQSLDLTLVNQIGTIVATDHDTGSTLELDIGGTVKFTSGRVGVSTATPTALINTSAVTILDLSGNGVVDFVMHDTATAQEQSLASNGAGLYIDIAGHATATNNVFVFRTSNTNSSYTVAERMRIDSAGNVGINTNAPGATLDVAGTIVASGATSVIRLKGYTVATLPGGTVGDMAYVTDALAPAFLTIIAAGGAIKSPVFFNGTNWVAF